MSKPESEPSFTLELVLATVVGSVAGIWTENYVLGAGIGIGLGIALSVLKVMRGGKS